MRKKKEKGDEQEIPNKKFNLILANINRNTLIRLIPIFTQHLKPYGVLIISGILLSDESALDKAIKDGFQCQQRLTENEWVALVLKKIL